MNYFEHLGAMKSKYELKEMKSSWSLRLNCCESFAYSPLKSFVHCIVILAVSIVISLRTSIIIAGFSMRLLRIPILDSPFEEYANNSPAGRNR